MNSHRFKQKQTFRTFLDQIPVVDKSRDAFPYALPQNCQLATNYRTVRELTPEIARESIAGTRTTRSVTISIASNVSVF